MEDILFEMCKAFSVSGTEEKALEQAEKYLSPIANVSRDANGNLTAVLGDIGSDYNIMLDAHIDQIGLIITDIDENGFLKADGCGGIDRRVLAGSAVKVLGSQELLSVVCCLPPHLSDGGEDAAMAADSIWLDTGLDKETVEKTVSPGDRAVVYSKPVKLLGTRVTASSLDNSAGVAALIKCAQGLAEKKLNLKVTVLLSSREEVGFAGAKTGAFALYPDEAIVVDVSFAKQPGVAPDQCKAMSKGPMVGISPTLDKSISKKLIDISVKNNIPYQLEIMGGKTGTNADVISVTKSGIKTGLVSIPLKNMHTQAEIVDLADIENTANLLKDYIIERSAQV